MKLKPLSDRILVKPDPPQTTIGGLRLPTESIEKSQFGTVTSVGPGNEFYTMGCEEGQRVMFQKHTGIEMAVNGENLLLMRETELLALVEE